MADDRSQVGKRSWRGKAEPDRQERPARTEKSSYKWANRGTPSGAGVRPPASRSVRLVASFVAFAVCLGVVIWLIWMLYMPRPAGVVLLGADYATNLAVPHNALGYQGLKGIERLSRAPRRWALFNPAHLEIIRNPSGQMTLERAEDWDKLITSLQKGFGEPTLILVLALHGGSDADGAYLMPNQMKRPEDRLDMKKVIASMKKLPAEKAKILVVEGAQVASDWRLGMLHNDFARRLKALEPDILAVPNLWVLSGCDEDQRCWASEGLGRTIFHYYITEALRGGSAAGADGRLSLDELYRYVRENVSRWAWAARGAVQEPVLLPAIPGKGAGAGTAAAGPGRLDPAMVHLATVEAATPAEPPAPPARDALANAWLEYRQLDNLAPHPSVYSPMRWRAYGAALIRFEQLLLAGAAEAAQAVAEQHLNPLEEAIRKDRVLSGVDASASVNLVMDALNGSATDPPEPREFGQIARAADNLSAAKIYDALRTSEPTVNDGRGSIRPLRNRLAENLLDRAQVNPDTELARAADRITIVGLPGELLPAEVHFLRMLQSPPMEGRPASFWSRAAQALRTRVLAERAAMGVPRQTGGYPYCEQVHAWTRPIVEKADANRRTGEDQLFAGDERTWDLAREDLATAESDYTQALSQAVEIRSALSTRDRALNTLPDYARWLVHRHPDDPGDDLAGRVEDLWARAHQLSEMLQQPGKQKAPATIKQTAQDLNAGLDKLVAQFVQERATIAKVRLRADWEVDTAAGAVLFPDNENLTVRRGIWDRLDDIRLHDQELTRSSVPAADRPERPNPDRIAEANRRRAAIQGTLAMAALGETWFGDAAFNDFDQGDYRKTRERLGALPTRTEKASSPWWKEAARDGDRIGLRFRTLRSKADALADEGRGITDFASFQSRLAQADGLARLVDRGEDPPATAIVEPSSRYRQARVHDLLVWMADRTWRDHWYQEKPTAPPYYQKIVARLFNDAQGLFPELREADQKHREELSVPGRLALSGPDRLVVTSERDASVAYGVIDETGANTVPDGIPVVRPTVKGRLSLLDAKPAYRTATRGPGTAVAVHLKNETFVDAERRAAGFDALLSNPASRSASLDVEGFFRGQVFSLQTKVDLQVVPDAVAIAPLVSPLASVAIRAGDDIIRRFGKGTGSIAIVLDCSGSMLEPIPGGTKWAAAKKALSLVLKDSVPPGTNLSIWTFSQFPPGDVKLDETGHIPRGVYTKEQLDPIEALKNKPQDTIKSQRTMAPWDPTQADDVDAMLNRLEPFFGTPLVDAMWKAAKTDLDKPEIRGFKNLIVLTDGDDTEFAKTSDLNPGGKISIPEFLKEKFGPLGVRITVVYFHAGEQARDKELENAAHRFEESLKSLEPPGRFVKARELGELTTHLRAGLDQKLRWQVIDPDRNVVGEPIEVTRPEGDELRWWSDGLPPAFDWRLRVLADRPYEQQVNLQSGDRLIVELVDDNQGGIAFRRVLYGDEPRFRDGEKSNAGSWRLTILGNQKTRRTEDQPPGLALMAALESTAKADHMLEQLRPGWVDLRLSPEGLKDSSPAIALRWRERMTYPAPVWQLDVPRWPTDPADPGNLARPILTAWWLAKPEVASAAAFDLDPAKVPFAVTFDDGRRVRVEDFAWEDHFVEVQPGQPPQSQPCLVIRLAYPMGSPYFIDPDSLKVIKTTGYEHRYYHRADKYAGLFWPVNESQFKILRQSTFRVISLDRLRELAEKRGQKIAITLEKPSDVVKLPEPPHAIQK